MRADFLLCESTYGDREHEAGSVADELGNIVNATVKRGGAIVIPAFAVDRTQLLLYYLRQLEQQQKIPHLPVYVDSSDGDQCYRYLQSPSRRSRSEKTD